MCSAEPPDPEQQTSMTETEIAALNPAQLRHRVVRKASASILFLVLMVIFSPLKYASALDATFADDRVSHGYTDSNGVKIHFATMGDKSKPLVVMLHGFPDFWFTWRDQMEALSKDYYVVAPDLRGYNLSDKPKGAENYGMAYLIGDLAAVIRAQGREKAVVIGHDWGGAVAWFTAMSEPQLVEKLILLNMPHPRALRHELATNQKQAARMEYARQFQRSGADARLDPERLFSLGARQLRKKRVRQCPEPLRHRGDAQLLQAEFSEGTVYTRHIPGSQSAGAGADDPWPQ